MMKPHLWDNSFPQVLIDNEDMTKLTKTNLNFNYKAIPLGSYHCH